MKKSFLFSSLMVAILFAQAQDSWTIKLNHILLLATSREDEKANTKKIKPAAWKKNSTLEIRYTQSDSFSWRRSFLFFDEQDNQLLAKDSVTYSSIPLALLRKLFTGKKEIRVYTIVSPVDPKMAIRIRRVHLCTLKLY